MIQAPGEKWLMPIKSRPTNCRIEIGNDGGQSDDEELEVFLTITPLRAEYKNHIFIEADHVHFGGHLGRL